MKPCYLAQSNNRITGLSKLVSIGVYAGCLMAMHPISTIAQSTAAPDPAFAVPATKLMAIGSFTAKATPSLWKPLVPSEMRQTAQLYLDGKIDQWYVKTDQSGVVFILNVTDPGEAKALLDKLPLGLAGLMEFQFIPLGPLSPLRALMAEPSK
jgi:hypothetical protein